MWWIPGVAGATLWPCGLADPSMVSVAAIAAEHDIALMRLPPPGEVLTEEAAHTAVSSEACRFDDVSVRPTRHARAREL